MKQSEARIIIYLNNAESRMKYARQISYKLQIDYAYLLGRLREMKEKLWIQPVRRGNKVFYELTGSAPLSLSLAIMKEKSNEGIIQL